MLLRICVKLNELMNKLYIKVNNTIFHYDIELMCIINKYYPPTTITLSSWHGEDWCSTCYNIMNNNCLPTLYLDIDNVIVYQSR